MYVTEKERLEAVRRYDILDTPPDGAFDRITAIAARLLNVPIAIVSIVDHDRIWFKSRRGLDLEQVDRDLGLCASCILHDGPWIISDARKDVRALAHPLVAGEAGIQFYLGVPLRTHDGFNLGTLCVLDFLPRIATEADVALLTDLAAVVMYELELRLSAREAVSNYQAELTRRELREDRIRGLLRELAHRSKNLLAVVQAIATHTMPDSGIARRYAARLAARVQGLAHTHDLIAEEDWRGARIDDLAARQVAHFVEPVAPRVEFTGPNLLLVPAAAQNLGLAFHELAANATEHGAFSLPQGSVSIIWSLQNQETPNGWLHLTWRERGGPAVKAIDQKGFGHLVLERLAPEGVGGTAQLTLAPQGVSWYLEMPASRIIL
jgi:two-component sensor histidine kinase